MDALQTAKGSAKKGTSPHGTGARKLTLPAQEQIGLEIQMCVRHLKFSRKQDLQENVGQPSALRRSAS
jgi:hypothetical protein